MAGNAIDAIAVQRITAMMEETSRTTSDDDFAFRLSIGALVISAPLTHAGVALIGGAMAQAVRQILDSCPPHWRQEYAELVEQLEAEYRRTFPSKRLESLS